MTADFVKVLAFCTQQLLSRTFTRITMQTFILKNLLFYWLFPLYGFMFKN